jgi:hypothetical protein
MKTVLAVRFLAIAFSMFISLHPAAMSQESDATGGWLDDLVREALADAGRLPWIEDGNVIGLEPRSVKLLQFLVDDYKSRASQPDVRNLTYVAVIGGGEAAGASVRVGRFKQGDAPQASCVLVVGSEVHTSKTAVVIATWEKPDGLRDMTIRLSWDGENWRLQKSVGPGRDPIEVKEVK